MDAESLKAFHAAQLSRWPLAATNFDALSRVETRSFEAGGMELVLQHNPARIASTAAKVDAVSLAARPCFLCASNRPVEQMAVDAGEYEVLVNPFPIFPVHFTIAAKRHVAQRIMEDGCRRFADMWKLAHRLPGLALFYNGPRCGASAPDHFHFQAVETERLPLFTRMADGKSMPYRVDRGDFATVGEAVAWFEGLMSELGVLPENAAEDEPRVNILCTALGGGVRVAVIPRRAHRPDFFGCGEGELLLSPASVDLAGVMVVPSAEDFHYKITPERVVELWRQTCYPNV